jgi:hypothetical protein
MERGRRREMKIQDGIFLSYTRTHTLCLSLSHCLHLHAVPSDKRSGGRVVLSSAVVFPSATVVQCLPCTAEADAVSRGGGWKKRPQRGSSIHPFIHPSHPCPRHQTPDTRPDHTRPHQTRPNNSIMRLSSRPRAAHRFHKVKMAFWEHQFHQIHGRAPVHQVHTASPGRSRMTSSRTVQPYSFWAAREGKCHHPVVMVQSSTARQDLQRVFHSRDSTFITSPSLQHCTSCTNIQ